LGSRPTKERVLPYKIHAILLYGRFKWLSRDNQGTVRSPTAIFSQRVKVKPERIKECLETLDNWGLIRHFRWWGHYFEVDVEIPVGMCIYTKVPEVVVPSEWEPEIMEIASEDTK